MRKHVFTNRSGFTLMEILIVVILLGILAMVVVPQITISSEDTKVSTLQSNLSQIRSLLEIYYAQHDNRYPGQVLHSDGTTEPGTGESFVNQLTHYSRANGLTSTSDRAGYPLGPYIKGGSLPPNPFNNKSTVIVDKDEDDLTNRPLATGDGDYGYKFFLQTGILIACDGGASNGVAHKDF